MAGSAVCRYAPADRCDSGKNLERVSTRQMVPVRRILYRESRDDPVPGEVLFAIDCSLSMIVSDPPNRRMNPTGGASQRAAVSGPLQHGGLSERLFLPSAVAAA